MSTDYDVACKHHKRCIHIGQRFAGGHFVFGHGTPDIEGKDAAGYFILRHQLDKCELTIIQADPFSTEAGYEPDCGCDHGQMATAVVCWANDAGCSCPCHAVDR